MGFSELIGEVTGAERTLTLFNPDLEPAAMRRIGRYFEPQQITVRTVGTDESHPRNVAVLHEGPEMIAASDLAAVYRRIDPKEGLTGSTDLAGVDVPDVLQHVDDTTFTAFGKRRMIIASREMEQRAWQAGEGTVYAGFQELSRVAGQESIYTDLADTGITTHVFGLPDWSPPAEMGVVPHGIDHEEIATSWFVVYDGDGDPDRKCGLLGGEVGDNRYNGFWTYRADLVDRIGTYIYDRYIS